MVRLTAILCKYRPHWWIADPNHFTPDKRAFRRMKQLELTKSFAGRHRNIYKIALNFWWRTIRHSNRDRPLRMFYLRDMANQRIWAGLQEHRFPFKYFGGILPIFGCELSRKSCAALAIWEPRSFEALTHICRAYVQENPLGATSEALKKTDAVITRDMLKGPRP